MVDWYEPSYCLFVAGGTLTMEDLRLFKVREEHAWTIPLGDYQMHIPPPPAGGALLALILNIMKGIWLAIFLFVIFTYISAYISFYMQPLR